MIKRIVKWPHNCHSWFHNLPKQPLQQGHVTQAITVNQQYKFPLELRSNIRTDIICSWLWQSWYYENYTIIISPHRYYTYKSLSLSLSRHVYSLCYLLITLEEMFWVSLLFPAGVHLFKIMFFPSLKSVISNSFEVI